MMMALLVRWLRRSMLELLASEAHAQHLASHDVLTGLPNRSLFDERLEQALGRTRMYLSLTAVKCMTFLATA